MESNNKTTRKAPNSSHDKPSPNCQQTSKNNQPGNKKGKPGATKKFQDYKMFKEHLATLGGSKYVPDVGVSITKLKLLSRMDFVPHPLTEEDTSKKIGDDAKGKPIYEIDPVKNKLAKQMQKEEIKIKKVFAIAYRQLIDEMKDKL
eukprot:jgi/Psemu1/18109/gm1.18109_g